MAFEEHLHLNHRTWFETPRAARAYFEHPPVADTMPRFLEEVQLHLSQGIRVLDVGCGPGILSSAIAATNLPGLQVFGTDRSWPFIQIAARLDCCHGRGSAFDVGDVQALPYATESVDLVVSQMALKWFDDRTSALREMYRVLRSGGKMLIAESGGNELLDVFELMHKFFSQYDMHSPERKGWKNFVVWLKGSLFTPYDLFHFLEDAGISKARLIRIAEPRMFKSTLDFMERWWNSVGIQGLLADCGIPPRTAALLANSVAAALLKRETDEGLVLSGEQYYVVAEKQFASPEGAQGVRIRTP